MSKVQCMLVPFKKKSEFSFNNQNNISQIFDTH